MNENLLEKTQFNVFYTYSPNKDEVGHLPFGWEFKKVENIFKLKSGDFLPQKDMDINGEFFVFGGNGINGKHNKFNLSGKNIIIGRVGALCGNVRLVEGKIWLTDNAFYISEYFENINLEYLEYLLKFIDLGKTANQAAQPVISYKGIKDLFLPIPTLTEQKRIVSKLNLLFEKIDKSIKLLAENIEYTKKLMASVLNDIFEDLEGNYGLAKIKNIIEKNETSNPEKEPDRFFTYIDISSIDRSTFIIEPDKYILGKEAPSRARKKVKTGDVLFATTRPNLKNIGIISEDFDNPVCSTGLAVLRVKESKTINRFLFYFLISEKLQELISPFIRGAQYPAISDKDLFDCNLPLPPLTKQEKIVIYLDQIFEKSQQAMKEQKQKLLNLKALKSSILNSTFKGEL